MFKLFLFVLAFILSGTATFLTAGGMSMLFSGLWFLFITIDLGRFVVSDYLIKKWKSISSIKYFTTLILGLLLCLSSVGVYNALDQRIPKTMHDSIVEAASYNKMSINTQTIQDANKMSYEVSLTEYNSQVSAYEVQKDACLAKDNADQEKCIRTYNANMNNAKKKLDTAKSEYMSSIDNSTKATTEEFRNKTEIAGILTTICSFTGGGCDSTQGLTRALKIIILLIILGLEIFALNILFIIHSHDDDSPKPLKLPKWNIKLPKITRKEKPVVKESPVEPVVEEKVPEKKVGEKIVKLSKPMVVKKDIVETDDTTKIMEFISDKLKNSDDTEKTGQKMTFEDAVKILKDNPNILENEKIKQALKNNPSLRQVIKKTIK